MSATPICQSTRARVTRDCWKPLANYARSWTTKGDGAPLVWLVGGAIRLGMLADVARPLPLHGVTAKRRRIVVATHRRL
ncbi:protein of unknown function [Paraburkholderia dioscoreae]|uniref:Uncharacterized protein n=1 Tax=Paraburkholderia dioscoreae TaxID=2604047 RepID=A0A5Q4ZF15_9BURK|nr:protein of unknown function [Paraburkholderia dioscoreae]